MPIPRKQYLWFPYLSKINIKKENVIFQYKGGEENIKWKYIHSIMIYGESIDLSQEFLEKCAFYKIPIVIHRRNMVRAVFIASTLPPDQDNIITKQILFRENIKKRTYISKKIIKAKFNSMNWLLPIRKDVLYKINNQDKIINLESTHARNYWKIYYEKLGIWGNRRTKNNIATKCLDAVSKFVSSIILRWVLYHNLSPYHGFLHKPTDYPALIYDLLEPYRGYFDKIVFDTLKQAKQQNKEKESSIIAMTIDNIKRFLDVKVYINSTRQNVTFHEVLHGIVLALRSYLLGESKRFIVPEPSKPNGGRPIKAGYKLYGHQAGKTDFWPETKQIAENFEKIMKIND